MKDKKFYRTLVQIEIISSENPYEYQDLKTLAFDCTEGDCSGRAQVLLHERVKRNQLADLLKCHGIDESFF